MAEPVEDVAEYLSFLSSYLNFEDGVDKDEARRLVALELCRIDGGVVCQEWRTWAPEIEVFLRDGSTPKRG